MMQTKPPYDTFREHLSMGLEPTFYYKNKLYYISYGSQMRIGEEWHDCEEKWMLAGDGSDKFNSLEELFYNAKIGGKLLSEIWNSDELVY